MANQEPPVEPPTADVATANSNSDDQGPGCLPAIMAASALAMMLMFISCGIGTWYLYQQRTVIAARTLEGDVIPQIEQSTMEPEEKGKVVDLLRDVVRQANQGKLENWQSAAIMERLVRAPLLQWGDLTVLEATIAVSEDFTEADRIDAAKQFSRLRRAVELGKAGAVDLNDVLKPVLIDPEKNPLPKYNRQAKTIDLKDTILRSKLIADRESIPDQSFSVELSTILRREIEAAKTEGGL